MGLFKKKEKPVSTVIGDYKGGSIAYTVKVHNNQLKTYEDRIDMCNGTGKVLYTWRFDDILNLQVKTEEEITRDVTLTRLAVFGLFAFGMKKKKKKVTKYIILTTNPDGMEDTFVMEYNIMFGQDLGLMYIRDTRQQIAKYKALN